MSNTPLTDHYTKRLRNLCDDEFVPIEFARKLERELSAVTAERDKLAEALQEIADCDFVITLPDRMDAVRAIAREALGDINWYKS